MAVTVIVENGTVVANANSLISVADAKTNAASMKTAAPFVAASNDIVGQRLIDSWRTFEKEISWFGTTVTPAATRKISFPRSGLISRNGVTFLSTEIPEDLINAQLEFAIALHNYALLEQGPSEVTSVTTTGVTVGLKARDSIGSRKDVIPSVIYDVLRQYGKLRTDEASYMLSRKMWG